MPAGVLWGARAAFGVLIFLRAFFVPYFASTGLGGSWQTALTEAGQRGLIFGRDFIFTYGPLGYLGAGIGNERSYWPTVAFSIGLALALAVIVAYCATERGLTATGFGFVLVILICLVGILHVDIVALALIVAFTLPVFRIKHVAPLAALLLGLACGLAVLMKFNMGVAAFASGCLLIGLRISRRFGGEAYLENVRAFWLLLVGTAVAAAAMFAGLDYGPLVSTVLVIVALLAASVSILWRSKNRQLDSASPFIAVTCALLLAASPAFRAFMATSLQGAVGYSSAMSFHGRTWEIGFAFGIFALVGLMLFANARALGAPLIAALLVSLFFGYKEGFVRQDLHVLYAFWTALLISGSVLRLSLGRRLVTINGAVTLLALFALVVVGKEEGATDNVLHALAPSSVADDVARLTSVRRTSEEIRRINRDGLSPDELAPDVTRAIGGSTVDVEPLEASVAFANGFAWNPEPVFQAYSAYTPFLDQVDAEHARASGAARILYLWEAIDGRYPLWDQPSTTREILCRYTIDRSIPRVVTTEGGQSVLVMARVPNRCDSPRAIFEGTYAWGEPILVAPSNELVFANLSIRYSPLGQLLKLIFRAPAVYVRVKDAKGNASDYRIVAENARDGILVAPFPDNLDQFQLFLERRPVARPRSIALVTGSPYFFESKIGCSFFVVRYADSR